MQVYVQGNGSLTIPLPTGINTKKIQVKNENGKRVKHQAEEENLILDLNENSMGQWLFLTW